MPATEKAGARPASTRGIARRSRPADDGVQLLPLLRGPVRGVPRDGDAPRVPRRRSQLSRQSLPLAAAPATSIASSRRRMSSTSTCRACWRRCAPNPTRPTPGRAPSRADVRAQRPCRSALIAALSVAAFILGFAAWHDRAVLFGTHTGPGAFYALMPHNAMARLFGARVPLCDRRAGDGRARLLARYRRACRQAAGRRASLWQAMRDAGTAALSRWRRHRLLQSRRTAERPAQVLSPPDVLRLRALLRVNLRGDALSLSARRARRRIRGGTCRWCSARSAASG